MLRSRSLLALPVCLVASIIAGCGEAPVPVVPAHGVVNINGKPAENIQVQFMPNVISNGNGPTSYGVTNEKGEFTLRTYDGRDGAVVGNHMVMLVDMDEDRPEQGSRPAKPSRLSSNYTVPNQDFTVDVKEGGSPIVIEVTGTRSR